MDQKHPQKGIQPHNVPLEEQCPVKQHEVKQSQSAQDELRARQVYRCVNCDIEFFWSPTTMQGNTYCCTGCAAGGPCNCDYSLYRPVVILGVIHYE